MGYVRRIVAAAVLLLAGTGMPGPGLAAGNDGPAPYPASTALTGMSLDWSTYHRDAVGSDNWATVGQHNGTVYTSWGDGGGDGPGANGRARVSFGLGRVLGDSAATLRGTDLFGGLAPEVAPCFPALGGMADRNATRGAAGRCAAGKSYSMLALGDALYLWLTPGSNGQAYAEARLLAAPLPLVAGGWRRAGWAFTRNEAPSLLSPMFVQAGAGSADLPFVYAYAAGYAPVGGFALQRGAGGGRAILMRAPKAGKSLTDRGAWEFYAGETSKGPVWTGQQALAEPVFEGPRAGWAGRPRPPTPPRSGASSSSPSTTGRRRAALGRVRGGGSARGAVADGVLRHAREPGGGGAGDELLRRLPAGLGHGRRAVHYLTGTGGLDAPGTQSK